MTRQMSAQRNHIKKLRDRVSDAATNLPTVTEWLARMEAIQDQALSRSIEGIWCGREGRAVISVSPQSDLIVGWYNGKVEYSYLT